MPKLAINGGRPLRNKEWPKWPIWDSREEKYLLEVLHSGFWGIGGKKNEEFARKFANYQGSKYAVTCSSGTAALEISLRALGIGYGDEVITVAYTFMATAQSILYVGAKPVFVDIDEKTYNINPSLIEDAITERTRAIMPVHIGGAPADMDRIVKIAKAHNLYIIEDAAQAIGAKWGERSAGTIGEYGIISFQSSKNITSGEGGVVLTNDEELAEKAWSYMNCGRRRKREWYYHEVLGSNYRMTEFQAAILLAQLERADELFKRRERNAKYLFKRLREIEGIELLEYPEKIRSAYHLFIFKYKKKYFSNMPKEKFVRVLNAEGIPISSGYSEPLYRLPAFINYKLPCNGNYGDYCSSFHLPVTERACYEEGVWIPQYALLGSYEDMDDIADAIIKVKKNLNELI